VIISAYSLFLFTASRAAVVRLCLSADGLYEIFL